MTDGRHDNSAAISTAKSLSLVPRSIFRSELRVLCSRQGTDTQHRQTVSFAVARSKPRWSEFDSALRSARSQGVPCLPRLPLVGLHSGSQTTFRRRQSKPETTCSTSSRKSLRLKVELSRSASPAVRFTSESHKWQIRSLGFMHYYSTAPWQR